MLAFFIIVRWRINKPQSKKCDRLTDKRRIFSSYRVEEEEKKNASE